MIERAVLRAFLEPSRVPQEELQAEEAARWVGREVGADAILTGSYRASRETLSLSVKVIEVGSGQKLAEVEASLPISAQLESLLGAKREPMRSAAEQVGKEPGIFVAGKDGVTIPVCVYCPVPDISSPKAMPQVKYHGPVVLSVVATTEGVAARIEVLKGAPYDLNQQAINAVKSWRFKPAKKDRKAVAARVTIEIIVRLS